MVNNREMKRYPLWVYLVEMIFFAALGLYAALHLSYTHYANYNILSYQSFCALTDSINCDTVAQSRFSVLLGAPVAVWGVVGYLFLLLLLSPMLFTPGSVRTWSVLFILSIAYSMVSLIYGFISIEFIESVCILCIVTYAVNFSLFLVCFMVKRRYSIPFVSGVRDDLLFFWNRKKRVLPIAFVFWLLAAGALLFYPQYWKFSDLPSAALFHHGLTEKGHPWIGAEFPLLTITEFTDYQCFPCKKAHLALRKLLLQYSDQIRLVHRHFPMCRKCNPLVKKPFHETACTMALLTICALEQGKFWPISDSLFFRYKNGDTINIKKLAEHYGLDYNTLRSCLDEKETFRKLWMDIQDGIRSGVRVTPSFIINKKLYAGRIPIQDLDQYLAQLKGK